MCYKPFIRIWIAVVQLCQPNFVTRFALPQRDLGYRPFATHRQSIPSPLSVPLSPCIGWQRLRAEYSRIIDRMPRSRAISAIVIVIDDPTVDFRSNRESTARFPWHVHRFFKFRGTRTSSLPLRQFKGGGEVGPPPDISLFRVQRHRRCASSYVFLRSLTSLDYERMSAIRDFCRMPIRVDKTSGSSTGRRSERLCGSNAPSDCYHGIYFRSYLHSHSSPETPSQKSGYCNLFSRYHWFHNIFSMGH